MFSGHDARMADHAIRIRSATCECGSRACYGDCCLKFDHQKSHATVSYSLPQSVHPIVQARYRIEDHIRLRAFSTFHKAGYQEHDLLVRFVRALVTSAKPIKNLQLLANWRGQFGRGVAARWECGQ
jgi:hypothetical protein